MPSQPTLSWNVHHIDQLNIEIDNHLAAFQAHADSRTCKLCVDPRRTYRHQKPLCAYGEDCASNVMALVYQKAQYYPSEVGFTVDLDYRAQAATALIQMICYMEQGEWTTNVTAKRPRRRGSASEIPTKRIAVPTEQHPPRRSIQYVRPSTSASAAAAQPRYAPMAVTPTGSAAHEDMQRLSRSAHRPPPSPEHAPTYITSRGRGHSPVGNYGATYGNPRYSHHDGLHLQVPPNPDYASDSGSNSSLGNKSVRFDRKVQVLEFS